MNKQALEEATNQVKAFITEVYESNSDSNNKLFDMDEGMVMFSAPGKGSLTLQGKGIDAYYACIDGILNSINGNNEKRKNQAFQSGRLSVKTVEGYANDVILNALGIEPVTGTFPVEDRSAFDNRLNQNIQEFKDRLLAPPLQHEIYLHIMGVALGEECFCFGGIRFFPSNNQNRRLFRKQLAARVLSWSGSPKAKKEFLKSERKMVNECWGEGVIGVLNVEAIDENSAYSIARETVTRAIEVLNFYSSLTQPRKNYAHAFLAGEAAISTQSITFALNDKGGFNSRTTINPPDDMFSLSHLSRFAVDIGLPKASLILDRSRYQHLGTFENRLLGALRFAGRATASRVREDAFLHYAVALECLLSDTGVGGEISYKLALRSAHLLGKDYETKKGISKKIKNFYGIRSAIVHRGADTVTDQQLAEFHSYVSAALVKALIDPEFAQLVSEEDFLDILEKRSLV